MPPFPRSIRRPPTGSLGDHDTTCHGPRDGRHGGRHGDTEPESSIPASGEDDSSDSDTGTIFFIATVVVVLGLGVFVYFRARSARVRADSSDAG